MEPFALVLLVVGGFVLVVGLFSSLIKSRLFVTAPLLALLTGILLGPRGLGLFRPGEWGDPARVVEVATGLTLAIALMEVALRLPPRFLRESWRAMAVLLAAVLPMSWLVSGALVHWTFGVSWTVALLIGALAAPTDPIVATSIVSGRLARERLPGRVRHLLAAESGANDGLAFPLFALPLLALTTTGPVLGAWAFHALLVGIGGALALGAVAGWGVAHALHFAEDRGFIERTSFLAVTLALSLLVFGLARLVGAEPLMAVFAAGVVLDANISAEERRAEERVQETVNHFFTLPVFILLGVVIPWEGWLELGPMALVAVLGILLVRRLPFVLALVPLMGAPFERRDAWFMGWFGPLGVAAVHFANEAFRRTGEPLPWELGTLGVVASLVAHGVSATPLTRRYGPPAFGGREEGEEGVLA